MSKKNKPPVKHHYVPQFLVRRFSSTPSAKIKKIFVYDKWTDKTFQSNIKNIACENNYYDFKIDDYEVTAEYGLATIEGNLAPIFDKINTTSRLDILTTEERVAASFFAGIQITRSPLFRNMYKDLAKGLYDFTKKTVGKNELDGLEELSEDQLKTNACLAIPECTDYAKIIFNKQWFLIRPANSEVFQLSDTPVVWTNQSEQSPFWGNLGLACKGIQIYLPLSKKLALAMYCPSIWENLDSYIKDLRQILAQPFIPNREELLDKLDTYTNLTAALAGTDSFLSSRDNTVFINSLQTKWSRRFLYSAKNDFSLPKRMIADNTEFKEGMKLSLG